jgi:hypothetical protein
MMTTSFHSARVQVLFSYFYRFVVVVRSIMIYIFRVMIVVLIDVLRSRCYRCCPSILLRHGPWRVTGAAFRIPSTLTSQRTQPQLRLRVIAGLHTLGQYGGYSQQPEACFRNSWRRRWSPELASRRWAQRRRGKRVSVLTVQVYTRSKLRITL